LRLRRILLIDDTPEIAELLTFALRDRGYEVFASGYTAAVNELVLEQRADAVVLDCSLLRHERGAVRRGAASPESWRVAGRDH
jgi:DNA-binding response OmpR family regulator